MARALTACNALQVVGLQKNKNFAMFDRSSSMVRLEFSAALKRYKVKITFANNISKRI